MHTVLGFGEIIWDVFPDKKCIGGAPFNFCAHAKKQGADVFFVSAVGEDKLGKDAFEKIKKYGIDSRFVSVNEKPTGACKVTLDANGVPSYNLLSDVAYDYVDASAVSGKYGALYFGTLALRGEHNREQLRRILSSCVFNEVFCDVNLRAPYYNEESVKLCVENATILKVSDEEMGELERVLYGKAESGREEFLAKICASYPNVKLVILTMGGNGSYVYRPNTKNLFLCPAKQCKVVSTVGAGDSYSATFLVAYLSGADIMDCMKKASEVSAKIVSKKGAI
ncbi:MAG: hypothetical protein J6C23_01375 [Clostridia bacterium]|nr:hypothetical protein [Clostridia bacterium]